MPEKRMWIATEQEPDGGWHIKCGDEGGTIAEIHGSPMGGVDTALKALVPYLASLAVEEGLFEQWAHPDRMPFGPPKKT